MSRTLWIAPMMAAVMLVLAGCAAWKKQYAEELDRELHGRPLLGALAPEIAGEDLAGEAFQLSDYRGQVVLLDFWGHW